MNRVLDRMNLDFVKAESGSMVTEAVKRNCTEKAENQMEKETGRMYGQRLLTCRKAR